MSGSGGGVALDREAEHQEGREGARELHYAEGGDEAGEGARRGLMLDMCVCRNLGKFQERFPRFVRRKIRTDIREIRNRRSEEECERPVHRHKSSPDHLALLRSNVGQVQQLLEAGLVQDFDADVPV
jgi:hypothetical protein